MERMWCWVPKWVFSSNMHSKNPPCPGGWQTRETPGKLRKPGILAYSANSETFSHVKITSTQVIARLKARKKLSLMILLADFRGSEKRVAHALKNKKRNALVPLFYGFTRFLPYTVLTELIMLLSIPVANFQVRYTRSPKHKN